MSLHALLVRPLQIKIKVVGIVSVKSSESIKRIGKTLDGTLRVRLVVVVVVSVVCPW